MVIGALFTRVPRDVRECFGTRPRDQPPGLIFFFLFGLGNIIYIFFWGQTLVFTDREALPVVGASLSCDFVMMSFVEYCWSTDFLEEYEAYFHSCFSCLI